MVGLSQCLAHSGRSVSICWVSVDGKEVISHITPASSQGLWVPRSLSCLLSGLPPSKGPHHSPVTSLPDVPRGASLRGLIKQEEEPIPPSTLEAGPLSQSCSWSWSLALTFPVSSGGLLALHAPKACLLDATPPVLVPANQSGGNMAPLAQPQWRGVGRASGGPTHHGLRLHEGQHHC